MPPGWSAGTDPTPLIDSRAARRIALTGVLAVLAAGTPAACSGSTPVRPTVAQARTVLAAQARAVRDHDRAAFLATIGTGSVAASYRSDEQEAFDNLRAVPLAAWSYEQVSPSRAAGAQRAADRRYGAPALIARVTLRYALRGVDPVPTRRSLWLTFVSQHGHVVITSDTDLRREGGVSWQGPWDFGPIAVERSGPALALGPADETATLRAVASTAAAAVPRVTAVWGGHWAQHVAVLVPVDDAEYDAETGTSVTGSPDAARYPALAVADGTDAASGTPYGQRVVLAPGAFARLSAVGRRIVLTHEITHIASAAATTPLTPRWLVEGLAEYVANEGTGQPVVTAAAELRAEIRAGHLPTALPDDSAFAAASPVQVAAAYQQAWLACRLIAAKAGSAGLVRLYTQVGDAPSAPPVAVADAVRAVLHESVAQFTAQWRASLRADLG